MVALVGISCAVAVYVFMRPRPQVVEPPKPALIDNTVTAQTKGTKERRVDAAGREMVSWRADDTKLMADGRKVLKGHTEFKFSRNNVRYVVTADEAEASGKSGPTGEEPSQVVFHKKVKMVGDDGFSVEAEDATYFGDEQRVVFPGEVAFTRDRLEGRGVGAELFMDRSVLWLNDQSRMTVNPEGNSTPVEITGKRIGLAQSENYIRAEEATSIRRESQVLNADTTTVYFVEGTQTVRRIELVGKSNVRSTGKSQKPEMRGDNIDLDFNPANALLTHARMDTSAVLTVRDDSGATTVRSGVIDLYMGANGETLTKLDATGPTIVDLPRVGDSPQKSISANGLVAQGTDPKGLDRAVFNGDVQYRETLAAGRGQPASVRLAKSQQLTLGLDGALNQVKLALFRQNFCFVGPVAPTATPADLQCTADHKLPSRGLLETTQIASADDGDYDAKAETLKLMNGGPTRPDTWVKSREIDLRARNTNIDMKGERIDASGQVTFSRTPTAATAKASQSAGLFESGKPMTGRSNTLNYSKTTGVAKYGGAVVLSQGANWLRAGDVTFDEQKKDIEATAQVTSSFLIEQKADDATKQGPSATVLNADKMEYKEAARRAVYTGKAHMESGEPGKKQTLDADQITLELFPDRRELRWLEGIMTSAGIVIARLPEGRQSTGRRLTYDAGTDRYVVTGTPAEVVSRSATKGPDVCEVGRGTKAEFPRSGGSPTITSEGGAIGTATGDQPCSQVIKK